MYTRQVLMPQKEPMKKYSQNRENIIMGVLIIALVATIIFSLTLGRYQISFYQLYQLSLEKITGQNQNIDAFVSKVIFEIRLPRVLAAVLIGGALSISGAVFQALFRNPMVSADILGVTSGAAFGASLGLLIGMASWKVEVMAFAFGIIAVMSTYFLSSAARRSSQNTLVLILSGMVIGTLFKSFISCVKYLADPNDALQAITFWLMGSLALIQLKDLLFLAVPVILGSIPLLFIGWKLNAMAFGEEEAMALGIHTEKLKITVIICSTIITSACVAISGIIGWVGLIIPHLVRMAIGPDNRLLIPASMLCGGIYLLVIDNISRTLFSVEIPLSILTSLIGTPFFIYLLFKTRGDW
ncbi:FecCD family ABC transporter permease [Acetobacterium bakii]|uniref:Fe3+-siderophore ABC transporter permease n=2 Tax=Acetobacterium bakii TaxID=52689 RepID=A0A0L6TVT6_9FIRM|nr:iron ABC transporter permease [Acetobacterium bakii]KNZ40368.1 Fe3+-siderophore ABC transporter permease [Acetobacterium bakii]